MKYVKTNNSIDAIALVKMQYKNFILDKLFFMNTVNTLEPILSGKAKIWKYIVNILKRINKILFSIVSFGEKAEVFAIYQIPITNAKIIFNVPNIFGAFNVKDFSLTVPCFLTCLL